jgi:pimeloyl-ACP methyl ester carboxylesterase
MSQERTPVPVPLIVPVLALVGSCVALASVGMFSASAPAAQNPARSDGFQDRFVPRGSYRIHVREQRGEEPAIVLMHGFPDNHHLYDRLVPYLKGRHVVTFDFLGWGESDKPAGYDYSFANQEGDVDAVINGLGLDRVVVVPHDASGPAGINWALDHPDKVAAIVALNTFYSLVPEAPPNPPEAIRLFSDPAFKRLTEHFRASPREFRWLYDFQVGGFIADAKVRKKFVPLLYRQFTDKPSTLGPFLALNADLTPAVLANTQRVAALKTFPAPVLFAFGEDPYLSPDQGRALAALFGNGTAMTIEGARHFPQLDNPVEVARIILTEATGSGATR